MATLPSILYYVSGHGYGHAGRAARLIQALADSGRCARVQVRSAAPQWLFRMQGPMPVQWSSAAIDVGVVERDARRIDGPATVSALSRFLQGHDETLMREVALAQAWGADLILADAPFLAGDVARQLKRPAAVVSNFLWDWIYGDPLFAGTDMPALRARVTRAYGGFDAFLRLPFHHDTASIGRVQDLPLVSARRTMADSAVAQALGVHRRDWASVVLFTYRGTLSAQACARLLAESPRTLFLWAAPWPADAVRPANCVGAPDGGAVPFQDLVGFADSVVAKLGYGTVASCAVEGRPLLYVDRLGYIEDGPLEQGARTLCQGLRMDGEDFEFGSWQPWLEALQDAPRSDAVRPREGADDAARMILSLAS